MKIVRRFGWAAALLVALSTGTAGAWDGPCPWHYDYTCQDGEYDCCCPKGVRCFANSYQCDRWCNGEWDGVSTLPSQEAFLKSLAAPSEPAPADLGF